MARKPSIVSPRNYLFDSEDIDWQDLASCRGLGSVPGRSSASLFSFEEYQDNISYRHVIDQLCSHCPVQTACLMAGRDGKETGVWGGIYLEDGLPHEKYNEHKTEEFYLNLKAKINARR